jgi:hypothetical protein
VTIREYLRRETRVGYAILAAAWLSVPLGLAITGRIEYVPWLVLVAAGGVLIAIVWLARQVRCPACGARCGHVASEIAFPVRWMPRVTFCPYCGVSLDTPVVPPRQTL